MRLLSPTLERVLGQPVVLDNRPGAGGTVGTAHIAGERPDGYSLVLANAGPMAIAQTLFPNLAYDVRRSFSYVMLVGGAPMVVGVRPNGPIQNMADYLAAARVQPEAMSYGSAGIGSVGHLSGMLWAREAGVQLMHVPFRGGGEAEQQVLGGSDVVGAEQLGQFNEHRSGLQQKSRPRPGAASSTLEKKRRQCVRT